MDDARCNRRNCSKVLSNSKGDSRLYLWQLISNQMTKKRKYLPTHNLPGKYESYKAKQRPTNKSRSARAQQTQSIHIRTAKKTHRRIKQLHNLFIHSFSANLYPT